MKNLLLILSCLFSINITQAQTWSAVSSGTNNYIIALSVYNGELYAGGVFDSAGGVAANRIAKWNGTNWSSVGVGIKGTNVSSLAVYNSEIYVGGLFDSAGNVSANNIAKWNGTSWSNVGTGVVPGFIQPSGVFALAVYNGELYAGGSFDSTNNIFTSNISKWNGSNWSAVGTGISRTVSGVSTTVNSMVVFNGELYVAGLFDIAGGNPVHSIAKWNGINWSDVGNGIPCTGGTDIISLAVYNGDLYAAGAFDISCGNIGNHIAKWNGINWSALGSGIDSDVGALIDYHNELFAAGHVNTAGGVSVHGIAKWNGTIWSGLGSGVLGAPRSLTIFNDDLYVGGSFISSGGIPTDNISKWNSPLGIEETNFIELINSFPNPASDKITIECNMSNYLFELLDITGSPLIKEALTTNKFELDLNNFSKGMYFVTITHENKQVHQRILKQ